MSFNPGDKVVCVDDSPHLLTTQLGRLTKGSVYCVGSWHSAGRFCILHLVGDPCVINPVTVKYPPPQPFGWGSHRFRLAWTERLAEPASVEVHA